MTKEITNVYVLDTSAIMALMQVEAGADIVRQILRQATTREISIFVSFMTFMEIHYVALREYNENMANERLRILNSFPITRVESKEDTEIIASEIKSKYSLSVADAWIVALAKEHNAILVHKDPEFDQVESEIRMLKLPYKPKNL
jgi:predicted nucleic acid-binding protein